jgi:hypothetical protein
MAYYDVSQLAVDPDFSLRVAACYSTETAGTADAEYPTTWAADHLWTIAGAPGFGDAYASAVAGGVPNPGRDPAVISDAQILAAVQAIGTA